MFFVVFIGLQLHVQPLTCFGAIIASNNNKKKTIYMDLKCDMNTRIFSYYGDFLPSHSKTAVNHTVLFTVLFTILYAFRSVHVQLLCYPVVSAFPVFYVSSQVKSYPGRENLPCNMIYVISTGQKTHPFNAKLCLYIYTYICLCYTDMYSLYIRSCMYVYIGGKRIILSTVKIKLPIKSHWLSPLAPTPLHHFC